MLLADANVSISGCLMNRWGSGFMVEPLDILDLLKGGSCMFVWI